MYKYFFNSFKILLGCFFFIFSVTTFASFERNNNISASSFNATNKYFSTYQQENKTPAVSTLNVPKNVLVILKYIRENGRTLDGYVGGRKFGNYEGFLPRKDFKGKIINYQEWDTNPKIKGKNRGAERLVTGSDNRAYYTQNHYQTFVEIK
jgi:ribonuclease T1